MPSVDHIRLWIRALVHRGDVEHDLDREMRFHLEMEIEQRIQDGADPAEARRQALLAFGGVERHKEATRDERGTRLIEEFSSDVRHTVRAFRARPAFPAAAALTMAIGIGAATLVFSIANAVLLRPVPGVRAPREVVRIDFHRETGDSARPIISPTGLSYPNLVDLQARTPALRSLAATAPTRIQFSAPGSNAKSLTADLVGGSYFETLGLSPATGRFFNAAELMPRSGQHVVVISDRLRRSSLGTDVGLGTTVRINGIAFTVVGIAPSGFLGIDRIGDVDAWLPEGVFDDVHHRASSNVSERERSIFMNVLGRLSPGSTPALVQSQIAAGLERLIDDYPDVNAVYRECRPFVSADLGLIGFQRRPVVELLRLLGTVAGIVLLVSCANTANLLLLRGVRRRGEIALRRALGASYGRVVRQQLAEGVLVSGFGVVAGVAITLVVRALLRDAPFGLPPLQSTPIDWRVLVFAAGLSIVSGLVCALGTGLLVARWQDITQLGQSVHTLGPRRVRLRDALSATQIAAAMTLVVPGILLARSVRLLEGVDVGFDITHTTSFIVDAVSQGYDVDHLRAFHERLGATLARSTIVDDVSLASGAPLLGAFYSTDLRTDGDPSTRWRGRAHRFAVERSFFSTLRIPIVAGTVFRLTSQFPNDDADPVVISRTLARALFGDADPIGRRVIERAFRSPVAHVVVGVAGDVRDVGLRGDPSPALYTPFKNGNRSETIVLVHSSAPTAQVEELVRRSVASLDPALPVDFLARMSARAMDSIAAERLFERLVTGLALVSALLAAAGLYGIVAFSIVERTREIGIRMAMGAPISAVVQLVTRHATATVVTGLIVGITASIWLSRLLASKLFGVTPLDPMSYAAGTAVLVLLGVAASALPARAATRVNPVEALRHE